MLERVIENWLDKANERSFQKPFCYMLSAERYTVVHLSRHCGMEMGKDVIAIAANGTPCAYQLKTAKNGKISLRQWRDEISNQVFDLVVGQIVHPSIDNLRHHRSYIVTNGELDEEVSRAIDDMNRGWATKGQPYFKLETIVRGQLLSKARTLGTDLWHVELVNVKTFLELFLESGQGILPKKKLSSLFEATFPFELNERGKLPSKEHCARVIASAAVLCSISISNFSNANNHVAEIEAWILYISYMLALVERWKLPFKFWKNEFEIATKSIYNSLGNLCDELKEQTHFVEGDPLVDQPFYRVRLTWLIALMSIYALWRHNEKEPESEADDFIRNFCLENKTKLYLWGEAAIPQFIAFFWYFRKIDATRAPDFFLESLISAICQLNKPGGKRFLANPYYEAIDILPHILGIADEPLEDSFRGNSYVLEGLVHLFVRRNWKQSMKFLWPDITRLSSTVFEPEKIWHFYRWSNKKGIHKVTYPKHTQEWEELKALAFESDGTCIPQSIKNCPILVLLFLCVYPHRINSQILRWLDTKLKSKV
ncbi:MAG: hypothetical protein AB1567_02580 [bacterium]